MIRYIRHHQIDKKLWDECIEHSPAGIIYAYSWYLDIICPGWDALVADDYSAVMPVTRGRKYLMDYIYPPFFAQQLGVFSSKTLFKEECEAFINAIPSAYRFIEMNLHISNRWIPEGFSQFPKTDLILDLSQGYNAIRKLYSENHIRNIKKAEKSGLNLFKQANVNDVISMFRSNKGRFLPNLQQSDYTVFKELTASVLNRNKGKIWTMSDPNGIPCAGAVFFESHQTGIFIFSSTNKTGKEYSAMHLLIDSYIRESCGKMKYLDFEGSNDPDLARFYRGFGATEYVYLQIKKNQLSPPWRWFKN